MSERYVSMKEGVKYAIPNVKGKQKAIRIKKSTTNEYNLYSRFKIDAIEYALNILSPNAFKVWAWLNANANNYQFALSGVEVQGACNISKGTYDRAVKELVNEGFLRPAMLFPNFRGYIFSEFGNNDGPYEEEILLGGASNSPIENEKQGVGTAAQSQLSEIGVDKN